MFQQIFSGEIATKEIAKSDRLDYCLYIHSCQIFTLYLRWPKSIH